MPVKIFVGNISDGSDNEELRSLFEKFGTVTECDILRNFGFVHMEGEEDAKAAIAALHGYMFNGNKMNVEISHGNSGGGRGRGGDRGGRDGGRGRRPMGGGGDRRGGGGRGGGRGRGGRDFGSGDRGRGRFDPYARPSSGGGRYPDRYPYPDPYERRPPPPRDYPSRDPFNRPPPEYYRSERGVDRGYDPYERRPVEYDIEYERYLDYIDRCREIDRYERMLDLYRRPEDGMSRLPPKRDDESGAAQPLNGHTGAQRQRLLPPRPPAMHSEGRSMDLVEYPILPKQGQLGGGPPQSQNGSNSYNIPPLRKTSLYTSFD